MKRTRLSLGCTILSCGYLFLVHSRPTTHTPAPLESHFLIPDQKASKAYFGSFRGGNTASTSTPSDDNNVDTVSAVEILELEEEQKGGEDFSSTVASGTVASNLLLYSHYQLETSVPRKEPLVVREMMELLLTRQDEYLEDLEENPSSAPHPKKLLHFLAPKIPAIKHSPDIALRVQSTHTDATVAARVLGSVAYASERYDRSHFVKHDDDSHKTGAASLEIIHDRRFEQLVECILCGGVDIKKRKNELVELEKENDDTTADLEDQIEGFPVVSSEQGLSIRDACRAAWGIAVLCSHDVETIGEEKLSDILMSLSLHIRELLGAKLQLICQGDLLYNSEDGESIEAQINRLSTEISRDAACSIWTFACVRACTGVRAVHLFEVAFSVLCYDPVELRRKAQSELGDTGPRVGSDDVVEKLARSDQQDDLESDEKIEAGTDQQELQSNEKEALVDWLSVKELVDTVWALAVHGHKVRSSSRHENLLSENVSAFCEMVFDRLVMRLSEEVSILEGYLTTSGDSLEDTHPVTANFETRDLCTIVWAVTELQDSLRPQIVDLCTSALETSMPACLDHLTPSDASNLLWGVSKCPENSVTKALPLIKVLVDKVLSDEMSMLLEFQPPEMSRTLWSLATIFCGHQDGRNELEQLASYALSLAAENTGIFGTEDLARILWAYNELHYSDQSSKSTRLPPCFGEILAIIESSLKNWESGRTSSSRTDEAPKESVRFATFFGRTRFHAPLLDQKLDDYVDDPDDYLMVMNVESRLPLLKDLPIDPSTLCKVLHSLSLLSHAQRMESPRTLLRITLRLLTSNNGRLLHECTIADIGRSLEAVLHSNGGNRELSSLFVRRVLRLLNEKQTWYEGVETRDICRVIHSLGKLGVNYNNRKESSSAHRRLQLAHLPEIERDVKEALPTADLLRLLVGLVEMNTQYIHPEIVHMLTLDAIKRNDVFLHSALSTDFLRALIHLKQTKMADYFESTDEKMTGNVTATDEYSRKNDSILSNQTSEGDWDFGELYREMVQKLEQDVSVSVTVMPVKLLRLTVWVVVQMCAQADELIDIIESETKRRLASLLSTITVDDTFSFLLATAMTEAIDAKAFFQHDDDERQNPFNILRQGIKAVFSGPDKPEDTEIVDQNVSSEVLENLRVQLDSACASIIRVGDWVNQTEVACLVSCEDVLGREQQRSLIELGRCKELIAQYRRYDFGTGIAASRFASGARRMMTKRMLSRLLP